MKFSRATARCRVNGQDLAGPTGHARDLDCNFESQACMPFIDRWTCMLGEGGRRPGRPRSTWIPRRPSGLGFRSLPDCVGMLPEGVGANEESSPPCRMAFLSCAGRTAEVVQTHVAASLKQLATVLASAPIEGDRPSLFRVAHDSLSEDGAETGTSGASRVGSRSQLSDGMTPCRNGNHGSTGRSPRSPGLERLCSPKSRGNSGDGRSAGTSQHSPHSQDLSDTQQLWDPVLFGASSPGTLTPTGWRTHG